MKKILFLVIDGLADEPIPQLKNKTPLEAAQRNNFDFFARQSVLKAFVPAFRGKFPWSEEGHLSLFGYSLKNMMGRGVYEAIGSNLNFAKNDLVLRGNLATKNKQGIITDRHAQRIKTAKTARIIKGLKNIKVKNAFVSVYPVYGHRLAIIIKGKDLSEKISDSDPKKTGFRAKKVMPLAKTKNSLATCQIVNELLNQANSALKHRKNGNCVITRLAGKLKKVESFEKKWGLKAACVSNGALYKGLAKSLGMTIIKEKEGNAISESYLKEKFKIAKKALKKYDFVFCHVKGADLLAENKDYLGKTKFIEKIDKCLVTFKDLKDIILVISGDHATSSLKGRHTADPVPIMIYPGNKNSGPKVFTEKEAVKNPLINPKKILPWLLKLRQI